MTLTEFLLARIWDDESVALFAQPPTAAALEGWAVNDAAHVLRHDPERIKAECKARREIIEAAWEDFARVQDEYGGGWHGRDESEAANLYPDVLKWLAWVNRHHPDYNESWRP